MKIKFNFKKYIQLKNKDLLYIRDVRFHSLCSSVRADAIVSLLSVFVYCLSATSIIVLVSWV